MSGVLQLKNLFPLLKRHSHIFNTRPTQAIMHVLHRNLFFKNSTTLVLHRDNYVDSCTVIFCFRNILFTCFNNALSYPTWETILVLTLLSPWLNGYRRPLYNFKMETNGALSHVQLWVRKQSTKTHLTAVVIISSTASWILCSAESTPMVMSVPQKSLSIDPTRPTIFKYEQPSIVSWLKISKVNLCL